MKFIIPLLFIIILSCKDSVKNPKKLSNTLPNGVLGFSGKILGKDSLLISSQKQTTYNYSSQFNSFILESRDKDSMIRIGTSLVFLDKNFPNADSTYSFLKSYLSIGKKDIYNPDQLKNGFHFFLRKGKFNNGVITNSFTASTSDSEQTNSNVEVIKIQEFPIVSSNILYNGKKYLLVDIVFKVNLKNFINPPLSGTLEGYYRIALSNCCESFINNELK